MTSDDRGAPGRERFSTAAVRAGMLWLYAEAHGLAPAHVTPGSEAPAARVPGTAGDGDPAGNTGLVDAAVPAEAAELGTAAAAALTEQGASADRIARARAGIRAARRVLAAGTAAEFSAEAYDRARQAVIAGEHSAGLPGHRIWPPTSQTVRRTLGEGYWNSALRAVGLPVSGRGRARGASRYTEDDYCTAVRDFLAAAERAGTPTSFTAYQHWARAQSTAGTPRPSGAGLRAHYGGWQSAKDAAARA